MARQARYKIDSYTAPTLITDNVSGATYGTTAALLAYDGLGVVVDSNTGDVQVNAAVLGTAVGLTKNQVLSPALTEGIQADTGAEA